MKHKAIILFHGVVALFILLLFCHTTHTPKKLVNNQPIPLDGRGGGIIAYAFTPVNGDAELFLINADGSGKNQLTHLPGREYSPSFSPDGKQLVFYSHLNDSTWSLFSIAVDGSGVRRLTAVDNIWDWSPRYSPNGQTLIFARTVLKPRYRSELWTMDIDGSNAKRFGCIDGQGPDWSPDGKRIVYFHYREGLGDIWLIDADGKNRKRLTNHPAEDWWPKWSPDGKYIAFQSRRDGNHEIYVMNDNGTDLRRLTINGADDEEPSWSPDGLKIVFSSLRDGHYELYTMNSDGTEQKRLTNSNGHSINPDWKQLSRHK